MKQFLHKKLVFFNFKKNEFRFYDVEVLSIGYNKMQVITSYGNLGSKGREQIARFEGTDDAFKQALKFAYNKIYEKKNEGYLSLSKVKEAFSKSPNTKVSKKKKTDPVQLVYVNFDKHEYRFYNTEIIPVGHNKLQVITGYGKLGTKGKEQLTRFEQTEQVFKEAISFSERKVDEKVRSGYISKVHAVKVIETLLNEPKKEKKEKTKVPAEKRRIPFGYDCDRCRKTIKPDMYEKINAWARGEGNWDGHTDYKEKVFCLDCQFDLDIFKKKVSTKNE